MNIATTHTKKPANEATTLVIRKDRYGNGYLSDDTADDLKDTAPLMHKSYAAEAKLVRAMYDAVELIKGLRVSAAVVTLTKALEAHKAGR